MKMRFETSQDIRVNVEREGSDKDFYKLLRVSGNTTSGELKNPFSFSLRIDKTTHAGEGYNGDDALWIPYGERGLKIIGQNSKYGPLEEALKVVNYIKAANSPIFPKIYSAEISTDIHSEEEYLLIFMENVERPKKSHMIRKSENQLSFVPGQHRTMVASMLPATSAQLTRIVLELARLNLNPENGWYKRNNLVSGKIIDFHRFEIKEERYAFPSNDYLYENLEEIYSNMVSRYLDAVEHTDDAGRPKWKGKIYQGFMFDNGYTMRGYVSNENLWLERDVLYDSYRKLPFVPLGELKGKKVLDIGSNQGFFSFQCAAHGASEVTGLELTKEDVQAANDIKEILGVDNVHFKNTDAVKYVLEDSNKYGLVIMSSVLHQIYPNFKNAEAFLKKIARSTEMMMFETPLNHKTMNISPEKVVRKLQNAGFKTVRLLYVYDAYSSGYRANYVCYSSTYKKR